jgi:S1-C subfamily serine protease
VQVGDPMIAIGNPFALDRTLTTGVVSALQRQISAPNGFTISNVIQTDAAINPGNSGGPLLDAAGRVIGINSQIATGDGTGAGGGGNVGIGFAVPINTAKKVLPQLKQNGRVQRAYLGITGVTIDKSLDRLNLASQSGVLVQSVSPGSPAAKAGIRGGDAQTTLNGSSVQLGGDVITKIDARSVGSMDDVISAIADKKPGDSVTIQYLRSKTSKTATVTLTQRPSTVPQQ